MEHPLILMLTQVEQDAVLAKTRELCQTILDQPGMVAAQQQKDAFLGDPASRSAYEGVLAKGQALQQKQQMGLALSQEEISDFEGARDQLLAHPAMREFMEAQERMQRVRAQVTRHIGKAIELGRLPTAEDLQGCGEHCDCSH